MDTAPCFRRLCVIAVLVAGCALFAAGCEDEDEPFGKGVSLDWPSTDPDRYHWDGLRDPYFEVWSWHVAMPAQGHAFTVTMGVANPGSDDPETRAAIVEVTGTMFNAPRRALASTREFSASRQIGDVAVADIRGTQSVVRGAFTHGDAVEFEFTVDVGADWPDTMGLLTNIPGFPINWHVNAVTAAATGAIVVDGQRIAFANAPALEDHFWGEKFPGATFAVLAPHFDGDGASLALFGGELLLGPFPIPAIMLVLSIDGQIFEMRTQDLDVIAKEMEKGDADFALRATKGDLRFDVTVLADPAHAASGLVIDDRGALVGGAIWHDALVTVAIQRRDENDAWILETTLETANGLYRQGVPNAYQNF
ncbi:hypothetical protein K8I61_09335 [bacterium]|nr:hypothetical protein [bacterium]